MKILKYIIIIILAYIVISLTIARTLVTFADTNKLYIEEYVNKNLGINIAINNIQGNWKGVYPSVKINLNKDLNGRSKNYSYPDFVLIDFNIYKSILIFRPVINKIYAENIFYKSNYKNFVSLLKNRANKNFIILENIEVSKSNIIIIKDNNLFNFENLKFIIRKNNIKIRANIDNNKVISADLDNILIDGKSLKKIDYKISAEGVFDYTLNNIFGKYTFDIRNSHLLFNLSGNYNNNNFKNKLSLTTGTKSNIKINGDALNDINIKAIFKGNLQKKIDFEFIQASFSSKNLNNYNFSNLAGIYNIASKNVSLYGDNININSNNLSDDFIFLTNKDFNFSGNIKNLLLKTNLRDFKNNFYISGNFAKCVISYKKNYIKNFTGSIKSNTESIFITFNSVDSILSYNSIIRKDPFFKNINGTVELSNLSRPLININNLSFSNKEIKIDFNGFINFKEDTIKIISNIDRLNMQYATDYIPLNFMKEKSSLWFKKAFKSGKTNNGRILINGKVSSYPFFNDLSGISFAQFPIKDLNVKYGKGWKQFEKISGHAYFNKKSAYFYSEDFQVYDSIVSNSILEIKNVLDAELYIKGELIGPIDDLFKYSNSGSLTNITSENLSKINGTVKTDFQIKVPFKGKKIKFKSKMVLDNINFTFSSENKIKNISGDLFYSDEKFFTKKSSLLTGDYKNNNFSFNFDTKNNGNFIIFGSQVIENKKLFDNPEYKNKISGKSIWDYKITVPGFSNKRETIQLVAKSNLNGTAIHLPKPFKKIKDMNSEIIFSTSYQDKEFNDIIISYNNIRAELKSLNTFNGYINFSGVKSIIPDNGINVLGKIVECDLNELKLIKDNSISKDYLQYINKINVSFGEFFWKDKRFKNLSISGFNSKKYFIFSDISVDSKEVNIRANGKVEFNNISSFNIKLNSPNVENLLNYWNYDHSLRDSSVLSKFNINWQGHLFDFELNKVYGEVTVNMADGRLKKVGNRASRIFGLFNIDLLSKRLSLDFDDVTKNGFYFSSLDGDFRIDNGNIFTTNLLIKGPSAEILAVGTTNIIDETYNMRVVASPEFGEALPAIALLGGPITAAATFAAEKLAKAFGKDINNLIRVKYTVTGPWSNPIIKVIEKNNNAFDGIEDLFK